MCTPHGCLIFHTSIVGISPIYPPKLVMKSGKPPQTAKPEIIPPSTLQTRQITPLAGFQCGFHFVAGGAYMSSSPLYFSHPLPPFLQRRRPLLLLAMPTGAAAAHQHRYRPRHHPPPTPTPRRTRRCAAEPRRLASRPRAPAMAAALELWPCRSGLELWTWRRPSSSDHGARPLSSFLSPPGRGAHIASLLLDPWRGRGGPGGIGAAAGSNHAGMSAAAPDSALLDFMLGSRSAAAGVDSGQGTSAAASRRLDPLG